MLRLLHIQKQLITFSPLRYFQRKQHIKVIKISNSFTADLSKLRPRQVNLKDLVPNFFSTHLPIFQYKKTPVYDKTKNYMENSYIKWEIPISSNSSLKESLIKFRDDEVRIGRILEVMDSVAGYVAYRHCFGSVSRPSPFTVVTGSVDSFHLFQKINAKEDISVQGFLNYTGKTSMEIEINLWQGGKLKSNSLFMMISRDSADLTKGYKVPELVISSLSEQQHKKALIRHNQAILNTDMRKKQMSESYEICPPSSQQIKQTHFDFLSHRRNINRGGTPIRKTYMSNTLLMHLQQRNIHGKIFGGFLMRQMLEIGWVATKHFLKGEYFTVEDLTNVYFKQAVEVGTGLKLASAITYVEKDIIVATVEAYTINFSDRSQKMSCYLHMFVKCQKQQESVYPQSYKEILAYLSSKKAYTNIFN